MKHCISASFQLLPVEKCAFSKDIFPGLSRSWNFKEKKIQDFPVLSRRRGNPVIHY